MRNYQNIPRSLPQTRLGALFGMFVIFGWLVVFVAAGIPVLYICFLILQSILGF